MTQTTELVLIADSAKEAAQIRAKYFWHTGFCKFGHTPLWYATGGSCVTCTLLRSSQWQSAHPERARQKNRTWYGENREKVGVAIRKRQLAKLKRTPAWADSKAIAHVYANCPEGYVVDHVVPLQGKLVSGLHVHCNLQYLTPEANNKKLNKFDPWTFES